MSLNSTPSSERIHIGIFGRRNAGKSSLINALTGQNLAIVSDVRGTTTDPVFKSMELLPLGPIVMIDTPGLDDEGELGKLRIQKAYQVLNKTDIAVLVIDGTSGITPQDNAILTRIQDKNIPLLLVLNKADLVSEHTHQEMIVSTHLKYKIPLEHILWTNTTENLHIHELKERLGTLVPAEESSRFIVRDLVTPGDFIVLVVPIDSAAPKGRLILPQQQTIRDLLDAGTTAIVVKETELKSTLDSLGKKPALVITDSQAFKEVDKDTPSDIPLTSFSILFARYKGKDIDFEFTSGTEFPLKLNHYKMIIHCGGCMLNEREMKYRLKCAGDASVPITNYGTAIAYMKGILERSIEIFPQLRK